jgi:hypothetical protein
VQVLRYHLAQAQVHPKVPVYHLVQAKAQAHQGRLLHRPVLAKAQVLLRVKVRVPVHQVAQAYHHLLLNLHHLHHLRDDGGAEGLIMLKEMNFFK